MPDAPASEYRPLPRQDTLLVGATILDGAGGRLIGDVLVRDGKIVSVGQFPEAQNVTRIDATGRWITPGLIDVHTHYGTFLLPQGGSREDFSDVTENSGPNAADSWVEYAVRSSDPAFAYALAGGVTTAQILPGSAVIISGRSVVVHTIPSPTLAQMRFPDAPQGLKMACGTNAVEQSSFPTSRQGQIAGLRRALREGQEYIQAQSGAVDGKGKGRRRGGDGGPGNPRAATIAGAIEGKLPVHLHCYRADDIANWIAVLQEYGIKRITVHHAAEAYKIAPLLAKKGICAAVWPDWWGFKRDAEDGIPENAAFLDAAGACTMMHSDIPVLGSLLNIEAAKAAAAGRRAGLDVPPEKAIRWITSNPARSLGLEDRLGTIAPGMNADLVLWSGDPFSVLSKPDLVFIDGAIAYDRANKSRQPTSDFEVGRPQRERVE
ncbi:MAG: amidohydrolase family protein [Novosphingobium sp.]|nr:amidohydrolase family protein [Novosphingobium sp.]